MGRPHAPISGKPEIGFKAAQVGYIHAVAGLGTSLGITTTAEGVETQDQFDRLRAEGCVEMQGFLFSPPRPASEIAMLLLRKIPMAKVA